MPVNTKEAPRRAVKFERLEDIAADLDNIANAAKANTLTVTGNWTPGQILEHCSIFMKAAIDGFPCGDAPWFIRLMSTLFFKKKALSGAPLSPGFPLPKKISFLMPSDDVGVDQGIAMMRAQVDRLLTGGEKFTQRSPLFGELTHDEWVILQLGHCTMHMSFIDLGPTERRQSVDRKGPEARKISAAS